MKEEIWKDVKGYEGYYQVSNLGRVKSLNRIDCKNRRRYERILKPVNKDGYLRVVLYKNSNKERKRIHRIVLETFVGINNYCEPNHINGIKTDNKLTNLEWVTHKENVKHSINSGLRKSSLKVIDKCSGKIFINLNEASRKLNIPRTSLRRLIEDESSNIEFYEKKYKTINGELVEIKDERRNNKNK